MTAEPVPIPDTLPVRLTADGGAVACAYFALCDRPATGLAPLGILDPVPICAPCAEKLGLAPIPAVFTIEHADT